MQVYGRSKLAVHAQMLYRIMNEDTGWRYISDLYLFIATVFKFNSLCHGWSDRSSKNLFEKYLKTM